MRLNFEKNLGDTDRVVRLIIGAALIWLAVFRFITGGWAVAAIGLGLSQLIEGALAY